MRCRYDIHDNTSVIHDVHDGITPTTGVIGYRGRVTARSRYADKRCPSGVSSPSRSKIVLMKKTKKKKKARLVSPLTLNARRVLTYFSRRTAAVAIDEKPYAYVTTSGAVPLSCLVRV